MNRFHNPRLPFSAFVRSVFHLIPYSLILIPLFALPAFSQQRWEKNYGGADHDYGCSVQQTSDGGYIVAGYSTSFGNGYQFYLVKTNGSGDTLWTRTYGGTGTEQGHSVQQTSDGGYIVAGFTSSFGNGYQFYLIKTNPLGDTLWTRTYGGAGEDIGWSVQQTSDMGYIVAGYSTSFGNGYQFYLVKTNGSGDTLWSRTYGDTLVDQGTSTQQTSDGGYIVAGGSNSFGNGYQVYLVKTNATGDTLWTKTYGGTGDDGGFSVRQTSDGGYIVAGYTNSFGNDYQIYLVKTSASGVTLWTRTYGGTSAEIGRSVQQTTDGGYIVTGNTGFMNIRDVYLVKTNATGDTLWTRTFGGASDDWGWSVQQTQDGGYIVAGHSVSFGNGYQVYLIKTDSNGNVGVENNKGFEGPRVQGIKITPNPFITFATLPGHEAECFVLYDISGRRVGTYRGDRVGEGLSQGVYFVRPQGRSAPLLRVVKVK